MVIEKGIVAKGDKKHIVTSDGTIICFGEGDSCAAPSFVGSRHHDELLAELTRRINAVLEEFKPKLPKDRPLRLIRIPGEGFLFAYTRPHREGDALPDGLKSDEASADDLKSALGIS